MTGTVTEIFSLGLRFCVDGAVKAGMDKRPARMGREENRKEPKMTNRVMRLQNNPNARGFIVKVLEETDRNDALGIINFKVIASDTAGTRKAADAKYDVLKLQYGAR
jgi:hypothetical protein